MNTLYTNLEQIRSGYVQFLCVKIMIIILDVFCRDVSTTSYMKILLSSLGLSAGRQVHKDMEADAEDGVHRELVTWSGACEGG